MSFRKNVLMEGYAQRHRAFVKQANLAMVVAIALFLKNVSEEEYAQCHKAFAKEVKMALVAAIVHFLKDVTIEKYARIRCFHADSYKKNSLFMD